MSRLRRVSGEKELLRAGTSKRDLLQFPAYTVRFADVVYVLLAFQKKSPSGIATSRRDVELIANRLKQAQSHHEVRNAKQ